MKIFLNYLPLLLTLSIIYSSIESTEDDKLKVDELNFENVDNEDQLEDESTIHIEKKTESQEDIHSSDSTIEDSEDNEEADKFAEEFYQHFDDLKDSDNLTVLLKPNSSYTVQMQSNLPDLIAENQISGNEQRTVDESTFETEHGGTQKEIKDAISLSIDEILGNKEIDKDSIDNIMKKYAIQIKKSKEGSNDKILNQFYKLADQKKGLKETVKDYQKDYTFKGVFFSQTTPVDCEILDTKKQSIYSRTNKNQGLFVINVDQDGRYEIILTNNANQEVEVMLAMHFGKQHTNYILESDIQNISDFMSNFKIQSSRIWQVVNQWLNHTEQEEMKSDGLLFFSGVYILLLTLILVLFSVFNVNQLKNITNRRSMV